MNDNLYRGALPTIRTAFFTQSKHSDGTESKLIYDIVRLLRNTPYEYMLYMAMIECLDGLEEQDEEYAESVEYIYGEIKNE